MLLTEVSTENNDCWPLHSGQMAIIDENKPHLIKRLETDYDLLPAMRATKCLTLEQIDSLGFVRDVLKRNGKLVDMLKRRSVSQFNEFIECLEKYQRHLIPFLTGDKGDQVSVSVLLSLLEFLWLICT